MKHDLITKELYCWACVNYDSYVTFWDSADEQEFILTSVGMVSEYEPSLSIFSQFGGRGLDLSKTSFLGSRIKTDTNKTNCLQYARLISFNQIKYENFNIFNLSSTRCMVLVHPFFRLYNDFQGLINGEKLNIEKPDIWPSCFENRDICLPPENYYKMPWLGFSEKDEYIYTPKKLTLWDTIYLNTLTLHQTYEILGFNDIKKVMDSIVFVNLLNSVSDRELLWELRGIDALERWIENMVKDKYYYIFTYYKDLQYTCGIPVFEFLDKYAELSWRDIRENRYVLEFLLSDEEKIKTMDVFAFLGEPNERVAIIKTMLEELKRKNIS